jgi:tellurium resistance protein TerD
MTINLEKGQRADLSKAGLTNFYVGLGWDAASGGTEIDLDVSAFILAGDKLISNNHFVYYNNLKDPQGSVTHTGDNLTGDGDGDDEALILDLSKVEASAEEISIVVTIYQAQQKGQNFGQVKNAFIRICELAADGKSPGTEVLHFDLEEDYSQYTAVQFGSIYKKNGEWKFNAAGHGYKADLGAIVNQYAQAATV